MTMNCDGYDPNPPEDGYCKHGVYVGGCGYDLMCGYCEMGEEPPTADEQYAINRRHHHTKLASITSLLAGLLDDHHLTYAQAWQFLFEVGDTDRYWSDMAWCDRHNDWPDTFDFDSPRANRMREEVNV